MKKYFFSIGLIIFTLNGFSLPTWDIKGKVCSGINFDVEILGDKLYIISDSYFEIDSGGRLLSQNADLIDIGQSVHDFHPAISVNNDSTVFVLRRISGSKENGFKIVADKKSPKGHWVFQNKPFGGVYERNYVLDIIALDSSKALAAHTKKVYDVSSSVLYYLIEEKKDTLLGTYDKYIRTDSDFSMKRDIKTVYVATGYPGKENEKVFLLSCPIDSIKSIVKQLDKSIVEVVAGSPRKAFPAITINQNFIGMSFGTYQRVYFAKIVKENFKEVNKNLLFTHTGIWHLNCGLSTIASTPDGKYYVSVALRAKNNNTAANSDLIFTYSADSGKTWSNEIDMGVNTDGNEGRQRPVLLFSNGYFYLLYYNPDYGGINLAKLKLEEISEILEPSGTPTITPKDSVYNDKVEVKIIPNNPSSRIYYTLDGSDPTFTSNVYNAPFYLTKSTLVKAIEYEPHHLPGQKIANASFDIVYNTSVNRQLQEVNIWPVPASDMLYVSSIQEYDILQVYNLLGSLIHSEAIQENNLKIDLRSFNSGTYFVKLISKFKYEKTFFFIKF